MHLLKTLCFMLWYKRMCRLLLVLQLLEQLEESTSLKKWISHVKRDYFMLWYLYIATSFALT